MSEAVTNLEKLGDYEFSCENYDAAYDYFKQAIELDANRAYSWYMRSMCAVRTLNIKEFMAGFMRARELATGDLLDKIEFDYLMELTKFYSMVLQDVFTSDVDYSSTRRDLDRIEKAKDAVRCAKNLIELADEIKEKVKNKTL